MRYEDIVSGLGDSEVTVTVTPQVHGHKTVGRDDWAAYMAGPLRRLWQTLKDEKDGRLLESLTYPDFEEFCWQFSRIRPQSFYSRWLCEADGL